LPHESGVFIAKWLAVIPTFGNATTFVWLAFTSPDIAGMAGWLIGALALTIFGYIVLRSIKSNIGNGE
jgi:hypothetical protein